MYGLQTHLSSPAGGQKWGRRAGGRLALHSANNPVHRLSLRDPPSHSGGTYLEQITTPSCRVTNSQESNSKPACGNGKMVRVGSITASNGILALLTGLVMVIAENVGAFDSSMIHPRALATTSDTGVSCVAEATACYEHESCFECLSDGYSQTALTSCVPTTCSNTALTSSVEFLECLGICEDIEGFVSCFLAAYSCDSNPLLHDYYGKCVLFRAVHVLSAQEWCIACER